MVTFWEIAVHLVDQCMFSLYFLKFKLFPVLGLRAGFLVMIASVPGPCIPFTFRNF